MVDKIEILDFKHVESSMRQLLPQIVPLEKVPKAGGIISIE